MPAPQPVAAGLSLRTQVLSVVATVNAAFFTLAGFYFSDELERRDEELTQHLVETLDVVGSQVRRNVDPAGTLNVVPILSSDAWGVLDDAVLIQTFAERRGGEIVPLGIDLNPCGAGRRTADFDRQSILRGIVQAMRAKEPVSVAGGRALPILIDDRAWGGCWVKMHPTIALRGLFRSMLLLFACSTLLLTGASFWVLRRLVLGPVEQLALGARRVSGGDYHVRLDESGRRDELADLVRSFNAMTAQVLGFNERLAEEVERATEQARKAEGAAMTQRRLAAMGELAAGLAHEINNPLGGLQNAVHSLGRGDISDARKERYLGLLSSGLDRIGDTVNRLRRFTPRDAAYGSLDIRPVFRDAIDLVHHRADRLGVAIGEESDGPGADAPVRGAVNELGQAFLNLLVNSLDALEEHGSKDASGPRITIRHRIEGGECVVEVVDNGPGVSAEELRRVSDLFYTTKEVGKGTGLGLALVHKVVAAHGGQLDIESSLGHSFTVRMRLPLSEEGAS